MRPDHVSHQTVSVLTVGVRRSGLNRATPCSAAAGTKSAELQDAMHNDVATGRRQRVLIVDDATDVRDVWREWLTIWGFEVDEARNGSEAVRKATERPPDLVLMDWTMPVLDGYAATEQLKAHAATAGVPVLALSADCFPPTPNEAAKAGCDACLQKPIPPQRLLEEIRLAFRRSREQRMHPGVSAELEPRWRTN